MCSANQGRWRRMVLGVFAAALATLLPGTSASSRELAESKDTTKCTPQEAEPRAYVLITEWLTPQERRLQREACMACVEAYNGEASTHTDGCALTLPNRGTEPRLSPWDCRRAYPVRVHPWSVPSFAPPPLRHLEVFGELESKPGGQPSPSLDIPSGKAASEEIKGRGHGDLLLIPMGKALSNEAHRLNAEDPIVIFSSDGAPLEGHYAKISLLLEGHLYESRSPEVLWSTDDDSLKDCLKGPICHIDPMDYRKAKNDAQELPQGTRLRLVLDPAETGTPAQEEPDQLKMILKDLGYWSLLEPMAFYTVPIQQGFFETKATDNLAQLNLVAGVNLIRGTRYTQWSLMPERSFFLGVGISNEITFEGPDEASKTLHPTLIGYIGLAGGENLNIALGFAPWSPPGENQSNGFDGALFLLLGPRLFDPLLSR